MLWKYSYLFIIILLSLSIISCTSQNTSHPPFPAYETTGLTSNPSETTTAPTLTPSRENIEYTNLTAVQFYDEVFSSSLTSLQKDNNWKALYGKWVKWSGKVEDVLDNNIVIFSHSRGNSGFPFVSQVTFGSSAINTLTQLKIDQIVYFSAKLVDIVSESENDINNHKYSPYSPGVKLDQGQFIEQS